MVKTTKKGKNKDDVDVTPASSSICDAQKQRGRAPSTPLFKKSGQRAKQQQHASFWNEVAKQIEDASAVAFVGPPSSCLQTPSSNATSVALPLSRA